MTLPTLLAWLYFVALAPTDDKVNPVQQIAYASGKVLQFLFPLFWFIWTCRRLPTLTRPTQSGMTAGVGFGVLVGGLILLFYLLLQSQTNVLATTTAQLHRKLTQLGLDNKVSFVFFGIFLSGLHSLLEEYYWRWFVFGWLRKHVSFPRALVLSSFAFMSHHVIVLHVYFPHHFWTAVPPLSLCVAIGGGAWAWLYHRSDNLYASWVSHLLVDVVLIAVGYDLIWG